MRCVTAVHLPDARTVLGHVLGKASSARLLALSMSVRVSYFPVRYCSGVGAAQLGVSEYRFKGGLLFKNVECYDEVK